MESVYCTPISVSSSKSRRRAISPHDLNQRSPFSSPYQVIDLNEESNEKLKERLLEQEGLIGNLREEAKKAQEELINKSGLNESIIIEKSNRVSTQETRIFRRDLNIYEEELKEKKKVVKNLQDEINNLLKDNQKLLNDLQTSDRKREENSQTLNKLTERIKIHEAELVEKENLLGELRSELNNQQTDFNTERMNMTGNIENLTRKLKKAEEKIASEGTTIAMLEKELEKIRQECDSLRLRMSKESGEEYDNQMRRSLEAEQVKEETTRRVLNEVQQLSSKIECMTPRRKTERIETENFLQMSSKLIQENMSDLRKRNKKLENELEEKTKILTSTREELETMKKSMDDAIGNSDQTNKFLHEENTKLMRQKADIRCELLEVKRLFAGADEKIKELEEKRDETLSQVSYLREEKRKLELKIVELEKKEAKHEEEMEEMQTKLTSLDYVQKHNNDLKIEMMKLQERVGQLAKHLVMADQQCVHFKSRSESAEASRQRTMEQCDELVARIRTLEQMVENQRKIEQELEELRADNERQAKKIQFLNEEIQETHIDYRQELSRLAMENSKKKSITDSEKEMLSSLKLTLSQRDSELRSSKKQIDEIREDNEKLTEQLADVRRQQTTVVEENMKLRKGLADAVTKIEEYKKDCENARELSQRLAEELGEKEIQLKNMEDELHEKTEQVTASEEVVNYLHSQINVKPTKMPKLGRRSTLLSTVSESFLDMSAIQRESDEIRELESTKQELLRTLEQKKRMVERRNAETTVTTVTQTSTTTTSGYQSKSASELKTSNGPKQGTMRHDIPHKWKEVRHLSVLSLKCAICFVGIPTFGKAKKCSHCEVQVHAACASRVFNTCGMPAQCANYYRENHTTVPPNAIQEGRMNGWLRVYRDDQQINGQSQQQQQTWISSWAMMDLSKISFYTNDGADLDKPFFSIDLHREQWVMRAGMEMPVECDDQMRASNVLMIKMPRRNIYLLAPSQNSARRWSDCLQIAQRKRMMLTSRPTSMAEYTCLLVLHSPNNLKIYKTITIDDWIVFATQTGLFFTSISQPRNPMRIAGPSSVTSMEMMTDINCLSMVTNSSGQLALIPLDSLQLALQSTQPSIRPDILPEYQHCHLVKYHQQTTNGQRFLIVSDSTHIHVMRYNSARDVFKHYMKIETKEPVICIESISNGFFFASDTFYYVPLDNGSNCGSMTSSVVQLAPPRNGDYPISVIVVSDNELLLAYQNFGVFVDCKGKRTRNENVEWEQMPMEFVFTSPYLFVVHYDSIEILEIAEYHGPDSKTLLNEREIFECVDAHIIGRQHDSILISVSSRDTTEVHRFNTSFGGGKKTNVMKRRGLSPMSNYKRSKN